MDLKQKMFEEFERSFEEAKTTSFYLSFMLTFPKTDSPIEAVFYSASVARILVESSNFSGDDVDNLMLPMIQLFSSLENKEKEGDDFVEGVLRYCIHEAFKTVGFDAEGVATLRFMIEELIGKDDSHVTHPEMITQIVNSIADAALVDLGMLGEIEKGN